MELFKGVIPDGVLEFRLRWISPNGILANLGSGDPCRNDATPAFIL
jgi:hypothetical protein